MVSGYTTGTGDWDGDGWLLRLNKDGEIQWSKRLGTDDHEDLGHLIMTQDGNFLVGGVIKQGANWDLWIIKFDRDGNKIWEHAYGGSNDETRNWAWDIHILEAQDGYYFLTTSNSFSNSYDLLRESFLEGAMIFNPL